MERIYSICTRLKIDCELEDYLESFLIEYNKVQRIVFWDLVNDMPAQMGGMSKYVTHICNKFGLLKRTVNSIVFDMRGRIKAYKELKKTELKQIELKIGVVKDKIESKSAIVEELKPIVTANKATEVELGKYRKAKESLYFAKNKWNQLQDKYAR